MRLSAEQLAWSVHGTPLLADVNLTVEPGQTFGLVGPNGSGKTSLLRLLAGLNKPKAGRVLMDSQPLHTLKQRAIAQSVALVEQQADTTDRITVHQVVSLGRTPFLSALRPWSTEDDAIVAQALADVDMAHMADRLWHTLSGGERQRVHIARALAQQPKILLLDEPTNHLDIRHQLSILELVRQLPITVVISLHDLNQAMECDRIGVMDGGRLIDSGLPQDILTPNRLQQTFGVYAHVIDDPVDGKQVMRFHSAI
ncbi:MULTISPECIES: ABC transporter ATP-binding protein [Halomonadaceae]|uniref:Fe(3+) dicitrate transport ATP-binding protein FecE n=1 Tax=Vreelandella titanicae TaxID=664683 RepID=A0A1G8MZ28_9GAMM|nr:MULTISPECIES: ABC transporter ATP-binding protein [Halomonas]QKS23956.1 Fe(3+) dicitrate transport ATP-binding protein FecE [Halomonas titanicae]QNU61045.1 ABC transporter ATP-binding protein [Halomonas titanicae]CDG54803.1 Fe(3+) dicitrate transport ATP-binding protein FecE [Halomonas sp. A3H3]SDI73116.1 iron complex transport system ATP-binding protein [Halomonas titanicae]|tara:strand:+ start:524 stop:1288 length:765 start_codon:yes stop_codon:yes gene_type:complete